METRTYGYLNPRPEDPTRCIETVYEPGLAGIGNAHQCYRKRGYGPNGERCRQHAEILAAGAK